MILIHSTRTILKILKTLPKTSASERTMHSNDLKTIFLQSVNAVNPNNLIKRAVKVQYGHLVVSGRSYTLQKPVYIVGFGKAVLGMARELERALGSNLQEGIVSVPAGILKGTDKGSKDDTDTNPSSKPSRIRYIEGAVNNLPDEKAMETAKNIKTLVSNLKEDDMVIILISGGGSALLPLPKPPITLQEKLELIKSLANKGADIVELNCVRKKISDLKGGRLAEFVYPARAVSLILSDIVGDPLDYIASGPTVPNSDGEEAALTIVQKYFLFDGSPESIRRVLMSKDSQSTAIKIDKGRFRHVDNFVIGNNAIAVDGAREKAQELGYSVAVLSTELNGDVRDISEIYAKLSQELSTLIANPANKGTFKVFLGKLGGILKLSDSNVEDMLNMDFGNKKGKRILFFGGVPAFYLLSGNPF